MVVPYPYKEAISVMGSHNGERTKCPSSIGKKTQNCQHPNCIDPKMQSPLFPFLPGTSAALLQNPKQHPQPSLIQQSTATGGKLTLSAQA